MFQELFGNAVKELRTGKLISQQDLANASGIERAQICKIEQGKVNVTLDTIVRLSQALSVNPKELLNFDSRYNVKPFVKWAGGKTQILNRLKEFMPKDYNDYYEPFIGGGALLFALTPKKAFINDMNSELLCVYRCLCKDDEFYQMINELINHEHNHCDTYYYKIREMDRNPNFYELPIYIRAARMVYLNKSCFNGLYRVNSKGYNNVPSARKEKVIAFDRTNMNEIRRYFKENEIVITEKDFEKAVESAKENDFVYFDPPYDVLPDKNGFVDYSKEGFGKEEQIRLAKLYRELSKKGVKVMLSNLNTPFINELYDEFNIHVIEAKRIINSKSDGRGNVEEVIVTNY